MNSVDIHDPKQFIARLVRAGIRVVFNDNVPTAMVVLTDNGYEIRIGKEMSSYTGEDLYTVMAHEFHHIVRGDALRKNVNPRVFNLAADYVINETLDPEIIDKFEGVRYSKISEHFPNIQWPTYMPSSMLIYEKLMENGQEENNGFDEAPQNKVEDPEQAEQIHVKTLLQAREQGLEVNLSLKHMKKVSPRPQSKLKKLLQTIKKSSGKGNTFIRHRSYRRPGRIEGLRGVTRMRRQKLTVVFDRSGSMELHYMIEDAIKRWLEEDFDPEFYEFAIGFRKFGTNDEIGMGTDLEATMDYLNHHTPDIVVIITDGYFDDNYTLPSCPVVWGLTQNSRTPMLRKIDRTVKIS